MQTQHNATLPSPQISYAPISMLWPSSGSVASKALRSIILVVLSSCLIAISAKIKVPFWPVPMTMQTLAVMMTGLMLGSRLGMAAVLLYIAEGAIGIPVFANTPPNIANVAYIMGSTGGFLVGFVVSAGITGYASDKGWLKKPVLFLAALIVADASVLVMGCLWLAYGAQMASGATGIGFEKAFALGIQPFLIGDALKLALVAFAGPEIYKRFQR